MRTNEGLTDPTAGQMADPANYTVEEVIYPGDDDDDPGFESQVGEPCIDIKIGEFVMARFFGEDREHGAAIYMRDVVGSKAKPTTED